VPNAAKSDPGSGRAVTAFPGELDVIVEVPRWDFVKRSEQGRIELISPLPCPFNYGSVLDTRAADGDREDVVLLGPRLSRGSHVRVPVLGCVHFIDAGHDDAKWVCGANALGPAERLQLELFFGTYARLKWLLNALLLQRGRTLYAGLELRPE